MTNDNAKPDMQKKLLDQLGDTLAALRNAGVEPKEVVPTLKKNAGILYWQKLLEAIEASQAPVTGWGGRHK